MRWPPIVLTALLAACHGTQPEAPPRSGADSVPGSPAEDVLVRLSPQGREAWELLAATPRFTDDALYDGGETPKEVVALRILWQESVADEAFDELLRHGTPGGRLYALCGLYYTDPASFERGLASLRGTDTRIRYQSGCSILEDFPVGELIELERPDVVRLDSREQSIRSWKALDEARLSYVYDIAGGGFPNLYRAGGGYGEVRMQSLDEGVD